MTEPLRSPIKPLSTVWPDGSAVFWENNASSLSLQAALWNPKSASDHNHNDVNAIHLSAFGESIIRNVGYNGWGAGCAGATWSYVHDTAVSNNVVLVSGKDHTAKYGSGISSSFTNLLFDFASGGSGSALPKKTHNRNLIFIHPQDGAGGYYAILDEVSSLSGQDIVNVALHPDSNNYSITSDKTEYNWTVNHYSGNDAKVAIFLGTTPTKVEIKDGALCGQESAGDISIVGKYLYSSYKPDSGSSIKNIVTIIYPHNADNSKSTMTRVSASGMTGATSAHASSTDYFLESNGLTTISYSGISFRGVATIYRKNSVDETKFYFVRKGRSFNDGSPVRQGFDSAFSDITFYTREGSGSIISPGTDVTFYHPNITGVRLNGSSQAVLLSGNGWVKINVPNGTHKIDYVVTPF